jgi:hypothetical protein
MTKTADKTGDSALRANPTGETSTPQSSTIEPLPGPKRLWTALATRGEQVPKALIAKQRLSDWDETHA